MSLAFLAVTPMDTLEKAIFQCCSVDGKYNVDVEMITCS